jgi:hypothetical protein
MLHCIDQRDHVVLLDVDVLNGLGRVFTGRLLIIGHLGGASK